jgi:hypothetical protein
VRRLLLLLAPLALVAVFFVALAASSSQPRDCAPIKRGKHSARNIQSHLEGGLTCPQIRRVLAVWIHRQFPYRVDGWNMRYSGACSCHIADRRLPNGTRQRFVFV